MPLNPIDTSKLAERIPGWGADLDPVNRPGVPKEQVPLHGTGAHWQAPERQPVRVKIHKTTARKELTPVFGTPNPPRGLSGMMRDFAYTLNEDWISRWMTLLIADRVDMVETIVRDVIALKAGNPIRQMGIAAEFKGSAPRDRLQRSGALLAIGAGALGLVAALSATATKAAPESKRAA